MDQGSYMVSLGFTHQCFHAGVHVCQIFGDEQERRDSLLSFVRSGLAAGERTACFTDRLDRAALACALEAQGLSCDALSASGAFSTSGTHEAYFQDGRFDPDRMIDTLRQFHEDSVAGGYPAARVIGEMTSEILHVSGGARLMEYEARVSLLLRQHPVTSVCQYDANAFDGATIMKILKVHPLMVIRGAVVHNPCYVPPEQVLAELV